MTVGAKTKREKLVAKEMAIVDAATDAFLGGGMRAARMAEIAKAADVAEGTIYLYFKNKEALFAAVVARHWQQLTDGAAKAVDRYDDLDAQLEGLARYTLQKIVSDWPLFELTYLVHYDGDVGKGAGNRRQYVEVFDRLIQRGIDRGHYQPPAPVYVLRDSFFGPLEHAARSLRLRNRKGKAAHDQIIQAHMVSMEALLGRRAPSRSADDTTGRLESAVDRLEKLLGDDRDSN